MTVPSWIGVDWGTSNLRAFAINAFGNLLAEGGSDRGMGTLEPDQFESALIEVIGPWLTEGKVTPVFACGMVGARQGWVEALYRSVPCEPVSGSGLTAVPTNDPRIQVQILPGLSQAEPADVMRGEETQIAGLLADQPQFSGAICLPGTHAKWVRMEAGQVQQFQTFMTGEMYSVLSKHSVLRHSIAANAELDKAAFLSAALEAAAKPEMVASALFSLRATSLLHGTSSETNAARLSGLLIGQEIGIARSYWDGKPVVLIGATEITQLYAEALQALDINSTIINAAKATIKGLFIAVTQHRELN